MMMPLTTEEAAFLQQGGANLSEKQYMRSGGWGFVWRSSAYAA
jgi:hypothetical protein